MKFCNRKKKLNFLTVKFNGSDILGQILDTYLRPEKFKQTNSYCDVYKFLTPIDYSYNLNNMYTNHSMVRPFWVSTSDLCLILCGQKGTQRGTPSNLQTSK